MVLFPFWYLLTLPQCRQFPFLVFMCFIIHFCSSLIDKSGIKTILRCTNLCIIVNACSTSITLVLQRGVLQPLKIFFLTVFFLPNKLRQMLPGNHFCILNSSFDVYGVKLGGVIWVTKDNGRRGLVKSHDFYFAHFLHIWQDMCFKLDM